jgi:short-subunit dehydrogenase
MAGERIAVVTGASSGIGEATARALAARGWHCVLVARREERLRSVAAAIGGEIEVCDVGDREAIDAATASILDRHPAIHLLVNNAGIPARGTFVSVDLDLVEQVMRVNYLAGVLVTRALLPALHAGAREGGSHVVNVISVAGTVSFAPAGAYAASKHAQLAFSRALRAAVRGSGISVHAVLPGFVETEGFPQHGVLRSRLLQRFVIYPPRVADAIVAAVEKNQGEVVVPWFPYRLIGVLQAVSPGLMSRLVGMSDYRKGEV